jgi:hypothetical protein
MTNAVFLLVLQLYFVHDARIIHAFRQVVVMNYPKCFFVYVAGNHFSSEGEMFVLFYCEIRN